MGAVMVSVTESAQIGSTLLLGLILSANRASQRQAGVRCASFWVYSLELHAIRCPPGRQQSAYVCQRLHQPVSQVATLPVNGGGGVSLGMRCEGTHQNIHSLHLCQRLQKSVGMVQIQWHTADFLEVGADRKLQLGVAPLQQLVVVLDASLVVALDEGHFEGAL